MPILRQSKRISKDNQRSVKSKATKKNQSHIDDFVVKKQAGRSNGRRVGFETPTKKGVKTTKQAQLKMSGKKFKISEPLEGSSSDESAKTAATMPRPKQSSRKAKTVGR